MSFHAPLLPPLSSAAWPGPPCQGARGRRAGRRQAHAGREKAKLLAPGEKARLEKEEAERAAAEEKARLEKELNRRTRVGSVYSRVRRPLGGERARPWASWRGTLGRKRGVAGAHQARGGHGPADREAHRGAPELRGRAEPRGPPTHRLDQPAPLSTLYVN